MNSPGIARTNTFNSGLSSSQSMGDIYTLKIEDVKGNMLLSGPAESSMMITNWSLAVDLPVDMNVANSNRTTGRARFQEMEFTKAVDMATPVLYAACSAGTDLKTATLEVYRTANATNLLVLKISLTEPIISQIATGGYGDGQIPMDKFTINFTKITMEYVQQGLDGNSPGKTSFGWDLSTNVAV